MTEHKFEVGQKVLYTSTSGNFNVIATITKVTPIGKVRIDYRSDLLFNEVGVAKLSKWHYAYIEIATPEQIELVETNSIKKELVSKINSEALMKLSVCQLQDVIKMIEEQS